MRFVDVTRLVTSPGLSLSTLETVTETESEVGVDLVQKNEVA